MGQTVKELILAKQKELQDTAKIQSKQYGSALVGAQIYGIMNRNSLEGRHELVIQKNHWVRAHELRSATDNHGIPKLGTSEVVSLPDSETNVSCDTIFRVTIQFLV